MKSSANPYDIKIYPFQTPLSKMVLSVADNKTVGDVFACNNTTATNSLGCSFNLPIICKQDGVRQLQKKTSSTSFNAETLLETIADGKRQNTVWYLDLPLPNKTTQISKSQYVPEDFPLQMEISSDKIWHIKTWSDYLFAVLWYNLYEPYFNFPNINSTHIGKNTRIADSAILVAPYWIGDNVTIEDGVIISGAQIGNHARIGQGSIIRNSIINTGASIGLSIKILMSIVGVASLVNSHIQFSIVGDGAFVGGNVAITDVLLYNNQESFAEKKSIYTSNGQMDVDTHAFVLGCAIGEKAKIGSTVLLKPGQTIAAKSRILPQ